jgi:hypothetical protein
VSWLTALVLGALTLTSGCATTAGDATADAPVSDFRQIAGAWTTTGASPLQGSLIIQTNGRYWMRMGAAALHGQFVLHGGDLHYDLGPTGPRRGMARRVDDRGKELIRFVDDAGQVWMECERNL